MGAGPEGVESSTIALASPGEADSAIFLLQIGSIELTIWLLNKNLAATLKLLTDKMISHNRVRECLWP